MSRRKSSEPISPRHVLLFDRDWDYLTENFGPGSGSKLGVSEAVRMIIRRACNAMRADAEGILNSGGEQ